MGQRCILSLLVVPKMKTVNCFLTRLGDHKLVRQISKTGWYTCGHRLFSSEVDESDDPKTSTKPGPVRSSIDQRLLDLASSDTVPMQSDDLVQYSPQSSTHQSPYRPHRDSAYRSQNYNRRAHLSSDDDDREYDDADDIPVSSMYQRRSYDREKFKFGSKWKITDVADSGYSRRKESFRYGKNRTDSRNSEPYWRKRHDFDDDMYDTDPNNRTSQIDGQEDSHDVQEDSFDQSTSPDLMELEYKSRGSKRFGESEQSFLSEGKKPVFPGFGRRDKEFRREPQSLRNKPILQGEMLFGLHPVRLALENKRRQPYNLYIKNGEVTDAIKDLVELAGQMEIPVQRVDLTTLDMCSKNRLHQGVCLDVSPLPLTMYTYDKDDQASSSDKRDGETIPLWLLLYRIQDPMNFGAILRSAYLFGVDKVLTTSYGSCSLTPVVSKASSGVMETMDIYTTKGKTVDFIQAHQEMGWSVVGTWSQPTPTPVKSPEGDKEDITDSTDQTNLNLNTRIEPPVPVEQFSFDKPTIVIVGNEGEGVPTRVLSQCDRILTVWNHAIGEHAVLHSLNVSVATGIILHSMALSRQKNK